MAMAAISRIAQFIQDLLVVKIDYRHTQAAHFIHETQFGHSAQLCRLAQRKTTQFEHLNRQQETQFSLKCFR